MKLREATKYPHDWVLTPGYIMKLVHAKPLAKFPLLTRTKKIVVGLNTNDLKKIWEVMPRRRVKILKLNFFINSKENLAILIDKNQGRDTDSEDFFLINSLNLETFLQEENFFGWNPELLKEDDETFSVFPEYEYKP
jgi:hypothetical protein